jgi:hypothetical protein
MPIFAPFSFLQEVISSAFSAIGGQTYTFASSSTLYQVHYFTSSGNFEVLSGTENIDYMLVGGGGGSNEFAGAGGAGGVLTGSLSVSPQTYSFTVGNGGAATVAFPNTGSQGGSSIAFNLTAIGGGGGAGSSTALAGGTGGSGGGGSPRNGGAGSGTSPQGRNGGSGRPGYTSGNDGGSGGGGGFSATGSNGGFRAGGNGGDGINMSQIFGTTIGDDGWFAGGGAGFGDARNGAATAGIPGKGGGGLPANGVLNNTSNTAGQANTGGGSGAGGPGGVGRDGGSGIVVLRYPFVSIDTDAGAFLNVTNITDTTISLAINQLVVDLKNAGLWTKMKAIYPFVGGTADTHKWNLKNPQNTDTAFRLTYSGTITHNSNGVQGNGSNGFFNTYFNPSTELGLDDAAAFMYIRNNVQAGVLDFGSIQTISSVEYGFHFNARNASNLLTSRLNSIDPTHPSNSNSIGLIGISRTSSASYIASVNKTKNTLTRTSSISPNFNMYGCAVNRNNTAGNFTTRNYALFTLGNGLTSAEIDALVDINQKYQTTLGRFV